MGFLVSRRWALFAVVVVVLAYGCWWLGEWQFDRLQSREAANSRITQHLRAAPTPVGEVLAVGRPASARDEWRRVTATGTYLPDQSFVIRYQTREGASGVDIVTPLRTEQGPALLVDRGWMKTGNVGADSVDAPAPPPGQVTVVGWVRQDATGDAAAVTDRSARAVSSAEMAKHLDSPVYGGFVDAEKETPEPGTALARAELPDLGNGPHFFYGLQWWFFGLLAVFGFCYLAYDERRKLRAGSTASGSGTPSERPEHPAVDREHRAGHEARSR